MYVRVTALSAEKIALFAVNFIALILECDNTLIFSENFYDLFLIIPPRLKTSYSVGCTNSVLWGEEIP